MLRGKSLLHVEQPLGKSFSPNKIKGYFNDLTNKVLLDSDTFEKKCLPKMLNEKGEEVVFATTIFQYGLGCYDLFLQTGSQEYIDQFKKCVDWAIQNQDNNGGWDVSSFAGPKSHYGAMAQGEGVSLLIRAYVYFDNNYYLEFAKNAIDLMLTPLEDGGTAKYMDEDVVLMEFMDRPCILNGWIFALFGLYDFCLVCDETRYKDLLVKTLFTLKKMMPNFDNKYWSKYNERKMIASPFYHKLHISQLEALQLISDDDVWKQYHLLFKKYQCNFWNRKRAFVVKAVQKIFLKD